MRTHTTLLALALLPGLLAAEDAVAQELPVQPEKIYLHTQPQVYSITKAEREIHAGDLRPSTSKLTELFRYSYELTTGTALAGLPLALVYLDGGGDVGLGAGWRLVYRFHVGRPRQLDILAPELSLTARAGGGDVDRAGDMILDMAGALIPVEPGGGPDDPELPGQVLVSPVIEGIRYSFLRLGEDAAAGALPLRFDSMAADGKVESAIRFRYQAATTPPILRSIDIASLRFELTAGDAGDRRIAGFVARDAAELPAHTWQLAFQEAPAGDTVLRSITVRHGEEAAGELRFDYQVFEPTLAAAADGLDLLDERAPRSSAWRRQTAAQNRGRWILPKVDGLQLTIRGNPGLRFMHLDKDDHLDLVNTKDRELAAFRFNPRRNRFEPFSHVYRPARASVRGRRPTGSHFISLEKKHADSVFNTGDYQALATSFYRPTADDSRLQYRSEVCFPRVVDETLTPDGVGGAFFCDPDPRLRLPVPLQFEGLVPWPTHLPATRAVETFQNQGARFVKLTREAGHLDLLYVGLRYTDARTGQVLMAPHRDTGNCRPWHTEQWSHLGKSRRVEVDFCQAFWSTADNVWREGFRGDEFWVREDLDPDGRPNERFVLPWKDEDPDYYQHYLGFGDVRFTRFERSRPYLVVNRPGSERDLYKLLQRRWTAVEASDNFRPPDEVWRSASSLFVDLDGDGRDDALIPRGALRTTYINRSTGDRRDWRRSPAYDIPPEVDLLTGGGQLVDLDEDGDLDLIFHDGSVIYLNRSFEGSGGSAASGSPVMTSFTDRSGAVRRVSEVP